MKNKKKWIITGIVVCLLAVIAVTVILIIRKNSNKSNMIYPIKGLMAGMEYDKAMKILKDRDIDVKFYSESEDEFRLRSQENFYNNLFETEVYLFLTVDNYTNRIREISFVVDYDSEEECERVKNKIKKDFDKRCIKAGEYNWIPKEDMDIWCSLYVPEGDERGFVFSWHNGGNLSFSKY